MYRTLNPPVTFETFRSNLFEAIYPSYSLSKHVQVTWQNDRLLLNWYGINTSVPLREVWDYYQSDETSPLKAVQSWAEYTLTPTYDEVLHHGVPVFNTSLQTWDFAVYRAERLLLLPNDEIVGDQRKTLQQHCLQRLRADMFKVQQKDAVLAVSSLAPNKIPHCAAAFNQAVLREVLSQAYDLGDDTRLLISSDTGIPVLIGHSTAVNRLSDGMEDNHIVLTLLDLRINHEPTIR